MNTIIYRLGMSAVVQTWNIQETPLDVVVACLFLTHCSCVDIEIYNVATNILERICTKRRIDQTNIIITTVDNVSNEIRFVRDGKNISWNALFENCSYSVFFLSLIQ